MITSTIKLFLFIALYLCCLVSKSQHSPYYFPEPVYDEGITSDEQRKLAGQVYFYPDDSKWVDNLIEQQEDNTYELSPLGEIKAKIYFKHSVRYYYEQYLKNPKMNQVDWEYKDKIGKKADVVYGGQFSYLVFVLKVNGKEVKSWREPLYAYAFKNWTRIDYKLWHRQNGMDENFDTHKYMTCEYCHYPLYDYIANNPSKESYRVELEIYPGKIICESPEDRGPDLMASGRFILTFDAEQLKELKKQKKPKNTSFDFIQKIRISRNR